ncbi:MAG: NUDIX domain-containing protein [Candidatus Micrarchaeota archaeon]|nr:NUDIX domain-containing protein [Candidatus Micrarchaeota archaeon]
MGEDIDKAKKNRILCVILTAIIDQGKILLINRKKEPYKGHWGMAGGKMEFGENIEETAVREAFEETGLKCNVDSIRGIATELVHNGKETEQHFILFIVQLKPETTRFVESEEGILQWFNLNELGKIKMVPSDIFMINEFILKERSMKVHRIKVRRDGETYEVEEFI